MYVFVRNAVGEYERYIPSIYPPQRHQMEDIHVFPGLLYAMADVQPPYFITCPSMHSIVAAVLPRCRIAQINHCIHILQNAEEIWRADRRPRKFGSARVSDATQQRSELRVWSLRCNNNLPDKS